VIGLQHPKTNETGDRFQRVIGDRRTAEPQGLKVPHSNEMLQSGVRYSGTLQIQIAQLFQARKVSQPFVGDARAVKPKKRQVAESSNPLRSGVSYLWAKKR
jgi:hypothetical protein